MVTAGYLVLAVILHGMAARQAAEGLTPMVTDFNTFYAVALLEADHAAQAVYDGALMQAAERRAARLAYPGLTERQLSPVPPFVWLYPPTAILLVMPLAALPYWVAYVVWIVVTAAVWVVALHRMRPDPSTLPLALALPATFLNGMFGQMGFLTAGLLGLGLAWLVERPLLAGVAFGLLTVKPHFGLLLPIALVCGGHWRTIGAAALTAVAVAAVSLAAFGPEPWAAFAAHARDGGALLTAGAVPWTLMPTVYPALRLLGLPESLAVGGQTAVALAAVGAVVWAWRRPAAPADRAGVLCLATLLALPFAYAYDLTLLAVPIFWTAARRDVVLPGLAALLPFLGPGLAHLGLPVGPLVIGAWLVVTIGSVNASRASTGRAGCRCSPPAERKPKDRL
jgi:hypothetical protein